MSGKENESMDLNALDTLDLEGAEERVKELQEGGGEVVEASNDCVDGCKI